MQDRIWLKSYEQGIPATIGPIPYDSVAQYVCECCKRYSELPALNSFGISMSYADFRETGRRIAGFFQEELRLRKGDRLALMLPNLLQYPVTLLGALDAGLIVVNINPSYTARELLGQLRDSGARAIVVFAGCAHLLEKVLGETRLEHVIVTEVGDLFPRGKAIMTDFLVRYVGRKIPAWSIQDAISFRKVVDTGGNFVPVALSKEDPAFLQYTGGTTGQAKAAVLSHGNILANIEQTRLWISGHVREGKERVVLALPLYHIFGLTISFLSNIQFGALHLLITDPRNTGGLIKILKKSGFTVFPGVNSLFAKLLATPEFRTLDFTPLRLVLGGGSAIQSWVADQWQNLTGVPICQAYGLTEASPGVCCNPLSLDRYSGSVGLPVPSTLVKIRGEVGRPVACGEPGELFVKGPQVMSGYWCRPDQTVGVLSADGWLRTGDLATMDDKGFVRIVDRKKDLIIVSGFNVYPNEVEEVLNAHAAIIESGVIGKPHEISGEIVVAFVVRSRESLTKAEIEHYCRENLASYKIPREIRFVQEIPKTNVGKVLRRKLREL